MTEDHVFGTIIVDTVGSCYEWNSNKSEDFDYFYTAISEVGKWICFGDTADKR